MREGGLWKRVLLAVHQVSGVRLFRNNCGTGWVSNKKRRLRPGELYRARGGELILYEPRPLHAGLFKGSADGIGWRSVTITPDMVGQRVAVFLSIETKVPKTGRISTEQAKWDEQVSAAGGISIITNNPELAAEQIKGK